MDGLWAGVGVFGAGGPLGDNMIEVYRVLQDIAMFKSLSYPKAFRD